MAWYELGVSSYPDLKGKTQYTNSKRIADQFKSLARDFAAAFGSNGDRLSPNEGKRARARQSYLWDNRNALGVVVARPFTSRHDEVNHGNAIDVGVTMANGQNRALTPAEFAWMHTQCERRGFTWTGVAFGEPWHIEGATRAEIVPPYPDIIAGVAPAPQPPKPKPKPGMTPVGDIVNTFIIKVGNKPDYFLANAETMRCMHLTSMTQVNFWRARHVDEQSDNQSPAVLANFEQVKGKGGRV